MANGTCVLGKNGLSLFRAPLRSAFLLLITILISGSAVALRANTLTVPAGGDLQAAINAAQPGDTIVLTAGAAYIGPFLLPVKSGQEYITIQSSRLNELPPNQRVSPAQASLMAKILTHSGWVEPAIETMPGAHHFRFVGIEFTTPNPSDTAYDLIRLGGSATSLSEVPHHIDFDRCYIHAHPMQSLKRGIALNTAHSTIENSHISGFKVVGQDTQAICGWNGPGPFRIINNYLEAAGENIMFGGATPGIVGLIPSDIEIRRNHFYKPLSWQIGHPSYAGQPWSVKNLFELKNARRVTVDGNIFENNWLHAQTGWAIQFTVRTSDSGYWAVVEDVSFTNNIIRRSAQGINMLGRDTLPTAGLRRMTIRNNLFEDIGAYGGRGSWLQIVHGCEAVTIDHNTAIQKDHVVIFDGPEQDTNMVFTNNIAPHNLYGVFGSGSSAGTLSLQTYWAPPYTFAKNVIPGANASTYPAGNFYPQALTDVQFVDQANGNYRLKPSSPYKNAGTDGKDIGCDLDAINAAISGQPVSSPTPTPTPTVPTAPVNNPIDDPTNFVREHYLDFLNRDPDPEGLSYWSQQILDCQGDAACISSRRISVSAAFFIELEFQETASFVYRFYRLSLGRMPQFSEFQTDRSLVVAGSNAEASRKAFAESWIERSVFRQKYPVQMDGPQFIDALLNTVLQSTGLDLSSQRAALINEWNANGSRARIVRQLADSPSFIQAEYNPAFVLVQYFGYLKRDPDPDGYNFWLNILNNREPNNYRAMVCSFITSTEYQLRFGSVVARSNSECQQ